MADESRVLVRMRLIGAQLMARDTAKVSRELDRLGRSGKGAGRGLGQTGRQSSQTASAVGRVQAASRRAAGGLKGLGTSAASVVSPMTRAATAAAALTGLGFAAAGKSAVDFESAMAKVQSRLLLTKGAMGPLNRLAVDLGAKTNYSATEAAGAMDELASQGFNANQILKVLPGTLNLAAASGADLAQAAAIQTETLHAFSMKGSQASRVADILAQTSNKTAADVDDLQESFKYIAPVAKEYGQNLQTTAAAVGLLANVGIKGSQAGTTLRTALSRLSSPTKKARDAMATLHLKAGDLAGKKGLLSLPNILTKVARGSQGVSVNQRNAALTAIFGREALTGMLKLVSGGPGKLKKLSDALEHSRGAAKRAADIQRDTVAAAFDNLKGSVESAAISLTSRFLPAVKRVLNAGAGGLSDVVAGVTTGATTVRRTKTVHDEGGRVRKVSYTDQASGAQRAGANVRSAITAARTGITTGSTSAVAGYSGVAGVAAKIGAIAGHLVRTVGPAVAKVGRQLLDAIKPAAPFLNNVLLPLLKGIGKGVLGSVVGAFRIAVPVIKIAATALGFVGKLAAPVKPVIEALGLVIGFIATGPILKLVGVVARALAVIPKLGVAFRLVSVATRVARVAMAIVGGAARGIGVVFRVVAGAVRGFATGMRLVNTWLSMSSSGFGRALGAVTNFASGVIGRLTRLPGQAVAKIRALVGGIAGRLRGAVGTIVSAAASLGRAIVRGIVNAVKSAPGALLRAIGTLIDQLPIPGFVKGKVKGILGMHATGGVVRRPLQVVGERGPELAALPMRSRVFTAGQTRAMLRQREAPALAPMPIILRAEIPVTTMLDGRVLHQAHARVERAILDAR